MTDVDALARWSQRTAGTKKTPEVPGMSLATRSLQAISGIHLHTVLRQVISSRQPCRQYITASPTVTKPPMYGQPLAKTHAHLIAPEELTPGIPKVEYEERRKNLMDSLPQGSLVVCQSERNVKTTEDLTLVFLPRHGNFRFV